MKNAFYFILKAPFVLEIFKFLSTAWLEKLYAQPEDHSKKGTLSKSIKLSEHKKTDTDITNLELRVFKST